MNALTSWLTDNKLPIGPYIETFFEWLRVRLETLFDLFSEGLAGLIELSVAGLLWVPPLVTAAAVTAAAFLFQRSWKLAVFCMAAAILVLNQGYWEETMWTLAVILWATVLCMLMGVPLGILCAHRPAVYGALRPVLDLMQTLPTFVYLIPTLTLFGLGVVPGLISTVIFAIPAVIRLTYLGVSNVPRPLVEVGQSYGATRWQLLRRVEIPHAIPSVMAGMTQCIMLSLSMVVIAALVGTDGLGVPVVRALNTVDVAKGFEAGLSIVLLAIILDRLCKKRAARKRP